MTYEVETIGPVCKYIVECENITNDGQFISFNSQVKYKYLPKLVLPTASILSICLSKNLEKSGDTIIIK